MTYLSPNTISTLMWRKSGGDKKKYGALMREREKQVILEQKLERQRSLRIMLAKGLITQEEFDLKIKA